MRAQAQVKVQEADEAVSSAAVPISNGIVPNLILMAAKGPAPAPVMVLVWARMRMRVRLVDSSRRARIVDWSGRASGAVVAAVRAVRGDGVHPNERGNEKEKGKAKGQIGAATNAIQLHARAGKGDALGARVRT